MATEPAHGSPSGNQHDGRMIRAVRIRPLLVATLAAVALTAACSSSGGGSGKSSVAPASSSSAAPSSSAPAPGPSSAKPGYYLSLGDSLAFGYQQGLYTKLDQAGKYSPAAFDFGYSDGVLKALKRTSPSIASMNLGCPGETTGSYLKSGCPYTKALHTKYQGSQAAAALAYLKAHPGPGLITLSLGANDLNATINACNGLDVACIQPKLGPVFTAVKANLTTIVKGLRATAPQAKIAVLELYDPYAVDSTAADLVAQSLNGEIGAAAQAAGAVLVDAFAVFNPAATEKATLCRLTEYCTPLKDIHPTAAGYQSLTALFLKAAGLPAS
jgi:lysophospholipase L1-like esterase